MKIPLALSLFAVLSVPASAASPAMSVDQAFAAVDATADRTACAESARRLAGTPIELAYALMAIPYGEETVRRRTLAGVRPWTPISRRKPPIGRAWMPPWRGSMPTTT